MAVIEASSKTLGFLGPKSSETGRLIASFDWASTSLGPLDTWPQSLKTAVSILLHSPVPIVLLWGEDGVMLYNDAYAVFAGGRHPALLGSEVREGWPEVAAFNDNVMRVGLSGGTLAYEDQELTLYRHGRAEQVWMNLDYSPVIDESGRPGGVLAIVVETTKRVLSEREIKESGDRFRAFVTASSNSLYRMSPDWSEMRQLDGRGVVPDSDAPRRDWLEAYIHPDDHPLVMAAIERVLATRRTFDLEHRVWRSDGTVGWAHSRAVPILDADGRIVEWFGTASDVTDRHQAAERLRQSDERQRFLLDLGDRTRGLADPEAVIAATTSALGERLGVTRVAFAEIDEAQGIAVLRGGWTDGTVSHLPNEVRMVDFAGPMIDHLRSGRTLRVDDARFDARTTANLAALDAIDARAIVSVPLLRDGALVADLNLHQASARVWTDAEIDLIEAVADRTWAAVERSRAEAALRASEARLRFTSELDEAMRASHDAPAAMLAAAELLARRLGASRCAYAAVDADNDRFVIHDDYTVPGLASSAGTYSLDLFGPRAAVDMRSGRTLVIRDVEGELAPGEGREMFQAIGIQAIVCCPLVKDDRLVAMMAVHQDRPRAWHPDEVALVETVVERCWAHVERVGAEARLRASEARYRTLFESIDVGFCVVDVRFDAADRPVDYVFVEANPAFERQTGLSGAVGRSARELVPNLEPHWFETYGRVARTGEPVRFENGSEPMERWFDVLALRVGPPEARRVAILFNDISQRRQTELALRELNETLEQRVAERTAERDRMWETSPDLMLVIDFEGYFRRVNPAWTAVLGYAPEELVGHHVNAFVIADDHRTTVDAYELAAVGGHPRMVNRFRHKDGSLRWISWSAAPAGDVTYATGRDVTAEKARQIELDAAHEALRQAQKMEAVGQLTGGVAHDFNNLLTIIKSSTDLLRRPGLADERRQRYVGAISDTVDRASKLTGQLLAFARRQALKPEVFDATARIQAIADMLRTIVGSRVQIVTDFDEEGCYIEADASQFETALVNMAVNARDAMDGQGTLTVRIRSAETMPAIRGHRGGPGPFVAVSLTDTGSGIPDDKLAQIFEPFFTTKEVGKGTGLGLSQVYGFAKQSGGDVAAESVVGQGTTFTLYLPRANDAGDAGDAGSALPAPMIEDGHGQRVLVVEDNEEVGAFSTQVLQDLGYETTWATNGREALRLLSEVSGFDAVFSDVVMPGMSGVELGQEIRRRYPDLPVVLTSGYSHVLAEEGRHGFELLQKPYAAEELSKVLRRVTRGQRARTSRAPA